MDCSGPKTLVQLINFKSLVAYAKKSQWKQGKREMIAKVPKQFKIGRDLKDVLFGSLRHSGDLER
jgi:hypothetical protein